MPSPEFHYDLFSTNILFIWKQCCDGVPERWGINILWLLHRPADTICFLHSLGQLLRFFNWRRQDFSKNAATQGWKPILPLILSCTGRNISITLLKREDVFWRILLHDVCSRFPYHLLYVCKYNYQEYIENLRISLEKLYRWRIILT